MTRGQLYSQAIIELGYSSQDRRAHPLSVFLAMDTVRGLAIPTYCDKYGEDSLGLFCLPKILPVLFDTQRGRKYVQLPFQILGMSENAGLVQVSLPQEEEGSFVAVSNGMLSVYNDLEAGGASGKPVYWLEGTKIYFKQLPALAENILVKAIPSIYDLEDSDIIPQPYEFNAIVIEGTKARLQEQKQTVEDKIDDGRQGA